MTKRLVSFDIYCPKCAHVNEDEHDPKAPCNDCLSQPWNDDSRKPIRFKPAEEKR